MTEIVPWLSKLSNARDAKVVKLILNDALNELTGAAESRVFLFAENAERNSDESNTVTNSIIELCHQKKALFYLSYSDDPYFATAEVNPEYQQQPILVVPIRLQNPLGVVLSFFRGNAGNQPFDMTGAFDQDKCVILTEASAIALENVLIQAELSGQIAEKTAELVEIQQAADAANRIKSRYLSAASHDLRQPLQQLTSILNLMTRQSSEQYSVAHLTKMQRITSGMDRLLSRLLHLEQLEQGAIEPVFESVSLDELLTVVEEDFLQKAQQKGLTLKVLKSGQRVITDYDLLLQIIRNLVGNAIKYTDTGDINIYTTFTDDVLELFIVDSGPGMSVEQQQLVFDPFYQIQDARKQAGSYGLGLSLVKALAETLTVPVLLNSEIGKGTEFKITLPVSKQQVDELAAIDEEVVQAETNVRASILYLEDDEILIESFTILLEMVGFSVTVASNHIEVNCLLLDDHFSPDIIVTDKNLENGDDGLDMVKVIRNSLSSPALPAILLTGYTDTAVVHHALETVQKVLAKPVDVDVLIDAIDELLA